MQNYHDHFRDAAQVRTALAAYYGMVSFLDDNVGRVLAALRDRDLERDTLVIYTSDHGDNLGTRGFWGKSRDGAADRDVSLHARPWREAAYLGLGGILSRHLEAKTASVKRASRWITVPNPQVAAGNLDIMGFKQARIWNTDKKG